MLELASNLVASPAELLPDVPVMFLFSGAEEPLCQVRVQRSGRRLDASTLCRGGRQPGLNSKHSGGNFATLLHRSALRTITYLLLQSASAFMAHSSWASRAGCFINLESIGPGGSPIVFQHAGAWTIEAFAKGAVHPRGAIVAQVRMCCVLCAVASTWGGGVHALGRR
jgi:hypothetical protein